MLHTTHVKQRTRKHKREQAAIMVIAALTCCAQAASPQNGKVTTPSHNQHVLPDVPPTIKAITQPPKRSGAHGPLDPHAALPPEKLIQVALQHHAEGRKDLALATLDKAITHYPTVAQLLGVRGSLKLEKGHFAAALADLDNAVALAPDNPQYRVNRAQAYRQFGRPQEALADLNQAVALDENMLSARFNRGALLFGLGDLAGSLTDFNQCVAIDPHAAAPYFNRAAVYNALNQRSQAIADLERFVQISPSQAWKKTATDLLNRWKQAPATEQTKES